jgi:uncharacterized membrane protein YfcA
MTQNLWLIPLGFLIGTYGTLIGAGGGFILMPILLLLYPAENPERLTSISLAVVFFNALSGSVAYAWMRRIYISSLVGIGGGIIHVLALAHILNFPVRIATATSHFILPFMALTGTIVHVATGLFSHGVRRTVLLPLAYFLEHNWEPGFLSVFMGIGL